MLFTVTGITNRSLRAPDGPACCNRPYSMNQASYDLSPASPQRPNQAGPRAATATYTLTRDGLLFAPHLHQGLRPRPAPASWPPDRPNAPPELARGTRHPSTGSPSAHITSARVPHHHPNTPSPLSKTQDRHQSRGTEGALAQARQIRTGSAGGVPGSWARPTSRSQGQARAAPADSEVQAGTQAP